MEDPVSEHVPCVCCESKIISWTSSASHRGNVRRYSVSSNFTVQLPAKYMAHVNTLSVRRQSFPRGSAVKWRSISQGTADHVLQGSAQVRAEFGPGSNNSNQTAGFLGPFFLCRQKVIRSCAHLMLVTQSGSGNKSHRLDFLSDFRNCLLP
jgi:hypothetical protein